MKRQKEYRSITFSATEDSRNINGFIPYNSLSEYMGFYEKIAKGAFSKTLAESSDIRALVEHSDQRLLARTKNGSLHFDDREDGLYFNFDAPETSEGDDILYMVRSGLVNGCSFGFIVINDSYEYIDGKEVRTLLECRLLEVSLVLSEPAYPESVVFTRSLSQALEGKEIDEQAQESIRTEIEKLQSMLPKEEVKEEEPVVEEKVEEKEPEGPTEEELKAQAEEEKVIDELYARLEAATKILESA